MSNAKDVYDRYVEFNGYGELGRDVHPDVARNFEAAFEKGFTEVTSGVLRESNFLLEAAYPFDALFEQHRVRKNLDMRKLHGFSQGFIIGAKLAFGGK